MAEPLWTSAELMAATGGALIGPPFDVTGVSIDTRSLEAGDLFVALAGARDGHDFVSQARAGGAAGALVAHCVMGSQIVVPDTLKALEALGAAARDRASGVLRGAVTGSVGKTSVTQALAAGLALAGPSHASIKSYNNHIGVPLTLARMPRQTRRAVFEVGMNHAGEIAPLSRLIAPHAVVVTSVGPVHIENFPDGEEGVARAKAEIFAGLQTGGTAVLNADNRWFDLLAGEAKAASARVVRFGAAAGCDAQLLDFEFGQGGAVISARLHGRQLRFPIRQSGAHWGHNSLAVLLMLEALEVDLDTGLAALADFEPLSGRGAERRLAVAGGVFDLIDESYNANPVSMAAAIKSLGARKPEGRRIAVLTDMLELGEGSPRYHAELAGPLAEAGADLVFCAGPLMRSLWDALPAERRGGYAEAASDIAAEVAAAIGPGDVVMVKGSNGSRAGQIVAAMASAFPDVRAGEGGRALMLYLLYLRLAEHQHYVPVLNLLKYLTFRTGMSIVTAQVIVNAMGSRFIRWMQAKQGKGQPIRKEGIERHIIEKAGTPTMGGVMILAGLLGGTLIWSDLANIYVWVAILVTACYGVLGFLDDYAKVTKQSTEGLSGPARLMIEFLVAFAGIILMIKFGQQAPEKHLATSLTFPVFKNFLVDLGWFYMVFAGVVIVGAANAVNFTDGLDGLAIVPVMIAAAAFGVIAYLVGNFKFAEYLQVHFAPGVGELSVFCGAVIGAGLGFLWYNAPPARIFMGDTGSLALGGALGTIAVACKHEIVLAIVGGLFVAEALSVIIQVAYFKRTGRRVFLMAPIHHHFEKLGWAESTVVIRFWIVAIMLAMLGLATLKLR